MKLQYMSDLHLEFENYPDLINEDSFKITKTDADVIALAGDIATGMNTLKFVQSESQRLGVPIIVVFGNHEYYGHCFTELQEQVREFASRENIYLLEKNSIDIDGIRFLGCTLWTDFNLRFKSNADQITIQNELKDYHRIKYKPLSNNEAQTLTTQIIHNEFIESRLWLIDQLQSINDPTVVVTHHAPHPDSLLSGYMHNAVSSAFASRLDDVLEHSNLKLWIHGHLHHCSNYKLDSGVCVACNPRGYPGQYLNPEFNSDKCITI